MNMYEFINNDYTLYDFIFWNHVIPWTLVFFSFILVSNAAIWQDFKYYSKNTFCRVLGTFGVTFFFVGTYLGFIGF